MKESLNSWEKKSDVQHAGKLHDVSKFCQIIHIKTYIGIWLNKKKIYIYIAQSKVGI